MQDDYSRSFSLFLGNMEPALFKSFCLFLENPFDLMENFDFTLNGLGAPYHNV